MDNIDAYIYNPQNDDLISWLNNKSESWPDGDWDYYVTSSGVNDDIIFDYANNYDCSKRDFCVHCLYYLVGEYFNNQLFFNRKIEHSTDEERVLKGKDRVLKLLNKVKENSSEEVSAWKQNTVDLLSGKIQFDPVFWLNYMFRDDNI